jgi:predicted permease
MALLDGRFDDLTQDLRYAFRTLRRDAGFTAFAVIIIALGIGASATVFSVANALLLRPLPFRDPAQLVWIANGGDAGLSAQTTQVNHLLDLSAQSHSFSDLGAYMAFYGVGDTRLSGRDDEIRVSSVPVTQNFFSLLGVHPSLGRSFNADEGSENGPKVVLLSHSLWERRFGSDSAIVGKPITVNDASVTVVGVLPQTFDFGSVFAPGSHIDVFVPFPLSERTNRWGNTLAIIGRLKPSVSLSSATADVGVVAAGITAAHPERNTFRPKMISLRDHVSGKVQSALTILIFSVGVVMLIVCANLSNLLLARATVREKEMAIRAALGAGRRRLVRQMLTESVVLSLSGAALGLLFAIAATRAIAQMSAVSLPLIDTVRVDATAFAFTALLAVIAGLGFGIVPAIQIPEAATHDALRASGRGATAGRKGQWTRRSLVVSEIALACVLVVGSGLLIRSFLNVLDVDLGFRPESVAALRVDPAKQWLTSDDRFIAYVDEVIRLTKQVPGIQAVALSDGLPLGSNRSWGVGAKGQTYAKGQNPSAYVRMASDGYINAMGMHLIEGRDFTPQDAGKSEPVILINQSMARAL